MKKSSRSDWMRQVPDPPKDGIRLWPEITFKFTVDQKDQLAEILGKPTGEVTALLDRIEQHVGEYLGIRKRARGASPPAELRDKIVRVRGQACTLLESLAEVNSAPASLSPDGDALWTLLSFYDPPLTSGDPGVARRVDAELRQLVETIDRVLALDVQEIESQKERLQQVRNPKRNLKKMLDNLLQHQDLSLQLQYRRKIEARRGAPEKAAERNLTLAIVRSYEDNMGAISGHSPATPFYMFVQTVLNIAIPEDDAMDATAHRTVIDSAMQAWMTNPMRRTAGNSGKKS